MRKKMKLMIVAWLCLVVFLLNKTNAYAFVKNDYKLSNPKNIKYYVTSNLSGYTISQYVTTWSSNSLQIAFTQITNSVFANITLDAAKEYNNGTYGVAYHNQNDDDKHLIVFYKAFFDATSAVRNETIVHEVGHCLGLAHCDSADDNYSVMRALGFNKKAYPLSDDWAGIRNIYK